MQSLQKIYQKEIDSQYAAIYALKVYSMTLAQFNQNLFYQTVDNILNFSRKLYITETPKY